MNTFDKSKMIGKYLIIGLTYVDSNEEVIEQTQLHGRIDRLEGQCFVFKKLDGEEFSLPADLRAMSPAAPGCYKMRATGEVVEDPDYIMTWTVMRGAEDPDDEDLGEEESDNASYL